MFHTDTKYILKRMMDVSFSACLVLFVALLSLSHTNAALAATAEPLGVASTFAVLGGSTVTNAGPTIVIGDLGVDPGTAVTGFPPGTVTGGTIIVNGVAATAQADNTTAYNNLAGQTCDIDLTGQDLGGMTLTPGVYCFDTTAQLTGTLTLDAQGDNNAVWVFQIGSTLTTASNSSVVFTDVGQDCNVFWQVGTSATLGTDTALKGSILALASITLNTSASLSGRALAQTGAVTLDTNNVTVCSLAPMLSKAFLPSTISPGGVSELTITLFNPNLSAATLTADLIDTLPLGVVIATPLNASTDCFGGSLTASAGGTTVTLSSGSIIPAAVGIIPGTCTVTSDVTAATAGSYVNTLAADALQTDLGNNADPAIATLTVSASAAPTIVKSFAAANVALGSSVNTSFLLTNPNATALSGIAFTDTLPAGLSATNGSTATCGGNMVITGTNTLTFTGGTLAGSATCTITVSVTGTVAGVQNNTTGVISSTESGNGLASNTATVTVLVPPTIAKAFGAATIGVSGSTSLSITVSNPNTTTGINGIAFTDTLPAGLSATNGTTPFCGGGSLVITGGNLLTFTGGTLAASGNCVITTTVTGTVAGVQNNTTGIVTATGPIALTGLASNTATVTVLARPTGTKAFALNTIAPGTTSTLTITLSNANAVNITGVAFIDTYPSANLINATPAGGATTCGGVVTAANGGNSVGLAGGTIPAGGSCTVTVTVTSGVAGTYTNTIPVGGITTANAASNTAPITGTLTVTAAISPTVTKSFSPNPIAPGGITTLSISIANSNAVAMTGVTFTDTYPAGVTTAGTPNITQSNCGLLPTSLAGSVTLTNGSIPAALTCTITIDVTSSTPGTVTNTIAIGDVTTTNAGSNTVAGSANLTVTFPLAPTLAKAFNSAIIVPGRGGSISGVSTLTITLSNPNNTVAILTAAPLTDFLPTGVVIAKPRIASTTCGSGVVTAIAGGTTVTLSSGSTIPAAIGGIPGTCTVTVRVTALCAGIYVNTLPADALQTSNGNNALPASATLTVAVAPTLSKAFNKSKIKAGQVSTLTITLKNTNTTAATLTAALVDTLPLGVVIANPANAGTTCGSGIVTAIAGATTVTLSSGSTIPARGSCKITVNVTAPFTGKFINTLSAGALQTSNGNNPSSASATLTVK